MPKKNDVPKKNDADTNNVFDNRRRFRAIRRLCNPYPPQSADERLAQISDIAAGKAPPELVLQPVSKDLAERLAAGAASRSPRMRPKLESKRSEKVTHDRAERSGIDRTADVNV